MKKEIDDMNTDKKGDYKKQNQDNKHDLAVRKLNASAREVASKIIGRYGLGTIVLLVLILAGAAYGLQGAALAVVAGVVGSGITLISGMLIGITGTQEEKPEFVIIKELIHRLDEKVHVHVDGDKVNITHGDKSYSVKAGENNV